MNTFTVEYYTKSDGKTRATIEANTSAEAESIARQRDDFSQLITTRKEPATMTTPTPQPDRITAAEIRELFAGMREQIESLQAETGGLRTDIEILSEELHTMRNGLQQASQPPAQVGTFQTMIIETIVMTYDDNGKPTYKGLGAPYQKHGVRVWDEILPQFVDPATLHPGKNTINPTPARVLMNTPKEGKTAQPRKVTGKA